MRKIGAAWLALGLGVSGLWADAVVDSTLDVVVDDGVTTLREAVEIGGTITFDPAVFSTPQTIELSEFLSVQSFPFDHSTDVIGPGRDLLTIVGLVFLDNDLLQDLTIHGQVALSGGSSDLVRCRVRDSAGDGISTSLGGGMHLVECEIYGHAGHGINTFNPRSGPTSRLESTRIFGNGGSGFYGKGKVGMFDCEFSNNGDDGVRLRTFTLEASNCTFSKNGGCGFNGSTEAPEAIYGLSNCLIDGNRGGGIHVGWDLDFDLVNCTISGNRRDAGFGGGIWRDGWGDLTLTNCTVVGNVAGTEGGGIYAGSFGGRVRLENSIVAGNFKQAAGGVAVASDLETSFVHSTGGGDPDAPIFSSSHSLFGDPAGIAPIDWKGSGPAPAEFVVHGVDGNLIGREDGSGGRARLPAAEIVQPLADFGGAQRCHEPVPGSPAIDAGDGALHAGPFDQRGEGFPRVRGAGVDLGAVEFSGDSDLDGFTDDWEIARGFDHSIPGSPAAGTELLHYQFELVAGEEVENLARAGSGWGDGTLWGTDVAAALDTPPPSASPVGGRVLYCDTTGGPAATHVATGVLAGQLGMLGDYTATAWVCVSEFKTGRGWNDMMVFGQPDGRALHLGVRDDVPLHAHWGNDHSSEFVLQAQRWYHLAWRYEGDRQSVLVDGVEVSHATRGPLENLQEILVGTSRLLQPESHWEDRDFQGWIDGVRIYSGALQDEQIEALAAVTIDSDGDGQNDLSEAAAGTDPHDPRSVMKILRVTPGGGVVTVEWTAVPGKTYLLQTSVNLRGWDDVETLTAPEGVDRLSSALGGEWLTAGARFVRVRIAP